MFASRLKSQPIRSRTGVPIERGTSTQSTDNNISDGNTNATSIATMSTHNKRRMMDFNVGSGGGHNYDTNASSEIEKESLQKWWIACIVSFVFCVVCVYLLLYPKNTNISNQIDLQSDYPQIIDDTDTNSILINDNSDIPNKKILDSVLFLVFRSSIQDKGKDGIVNIRNTWASNNAPYLSEGLSSMQLHIKFVNTQSQTYSTPDFDVVTPPYSQLGNGESGVSLLWAINTYAKGFHWVFKVDDVTFVHIPNLIAYLSTIEKRAQLLASFEGKNGIKSVDSIDYYYFWIGCRLKTGNTIFTSGGAGYLINRPIIDYILNSFQSNAITYQTCVKRGNIWEDLCMAYLMSQLKIEASDTRDNSGNDRFNVFEPLTMTGFGGIYRLKKVDWYNNYHWYSTPQEGLEYMSGEPITFHYVKPNEMQSLFELIFENREISEIESFKKLSESQQSVLRTYVQTLNGNGKQINVNVDREFQTVNKNPEYTK